MIEAVVELKNPGSGSEEHLSVAVDFSDLDEVTAGQTISSVTVTQLAPPDGNLTVGSPTIVASGRLVEIPVSIGTPGQLYVLLIRVTLSSGQIKDKTVLVRCTAS